MSDQRVFGHIRAMSDLPRPPYWAKRTPCKDMTPEKHAVAAAKRATGPKNSRCDQLLRKFD
jgi:hypothetical protein